MTRRLIGSVLFVFAAAACAREPDGTLGVLCAPNEGAPAIIVAGETFDAALSTNAELRLAGMNGHYPLETLVEDGPSDTVPCRVPKNVPPGAYALEGVGESYVDRNNRSVFVLEEPPEDYIVAHIAAPRVAKDGGLSHRAFRAAIARVNDSDAAFALITGDLTRDGASAQFQEFLSVLNTCRKPTYVCAGSRDLPQFETFWGPASYMFRFGRDGYIAVGPAGPASPLTAESGRLHQFRRAIKPARWSVGFTHAFQPTYDLRRQLVLFVDNPLDVLIAGKADEGTIDEGRLPWRSTRLFLTDPREPAPRFFEITASGIASHNPAPPQTDNAP